jgi:hypothetical protein
MNFGGCQNLEAQYRTIGYALVHIERQVFSRKNQLLFREQVSFVPLEVLESYLEDLLDAQVLEDKLFIDSRRAWVNSSFVLLLGLLVSATIGYFAFRQGASQEIASTLSVLLFLPLLCSWYLSPRAGLLRRMAFARIVSREIAYRRGQDGDGLGAFMKKSPVFATWLAPASGRPEGSGVARRIH